jgi:hypothetical protein
MNAKLDTGLLAASRGARTVQLSQEGIVLLVMALFYKLFFRRKEPGLPSLM